MRPIPDPSVIFPNQYGTTCFLKNVVKAPNVTIGDYTYYDCPEGDPPALSRTTFCSTTRNSATIW